MSFIIIRTYGDEWKRDVKNDWFFESDEEIDREFMNLVESEFSEEEQFLHHPEVIKYLDIFGIYEKVLIYIVRKSGLLVHCLRTKLR